LANDDVLVEAAGGHLEPVLVRHGMQGLLEPYQTLIAGEGNKSRCGMFRPLAKELGGRELFLMTEEEVRWHEFPETGLYVIIDKEIWDVTGK
jgi:hypothetical protein